MAKKVRVQISRAAILELMGDEALVTGRAAAIAEACNAESSWGGYASAPASSNTRARARVWSFDNRNDEARDNRMVRNLGAGG